MTVHTNLTPYQCSVCQKISRIVLGYVNDFPNVFGCFSELAENDVTFKLKHLLEEEKQPAT